MREQKTKAQAKKTKNYEIIPTPCPHSQPDMNQPPLPPPPPSFIIVDLSNTTGFHLDQISLGIDVINYLLQNNPSS